MSPPDATPRAIFHLAFPVASLDASLAFYEGALGAARGRRTDTWCDAILFGHQLTLHERPEQVLPRDARGVRHFGAILGWEALEAVRARLEALVVEKQYALREAGTPDEHAKLLVEDPDGNLVELKAYRSLGTIGGGLES
jgi:extradiol dioxygenase family protein